MNYYDARARQRDGRFDYTCGNRRTGTCAVGFCAGTFETEWPEWDAGDDAHRQARQLAYMTREFYESERAKHQVHAAKYHADGHATAAEAYACYTEYILAFKTSMHRRMSNQQLRCVAPVEGGKSCGVYTDLFVEVDHYKLLVLCDAHHTSEIVRALVGSVGMVMSSY